VLIGGRDLDPLEAKALDSSSIQHVAERNLRAQLPAALAKVSAIRDDVYVHLDVDVLDRSVGAINSYSSPGGLLLEEVTWALEQLSRTMRPVAASITSFDPASDPSSRALDAVVSSSLALLNACGR
jgi:arginase